MAYDLIGDVHGQADALVLLLKQLGYRERGGAWRHPERTAIFLGDFIDRGPKQLATVDLARRMLDEGSALAVIGNHELNAIAWFLPDPEQPGEYLRQRFSKHRGEKNHRQHARFLAEVEKSPARHRELVEWFLTLPLWLELPELRVVHACWHPPSMDFLAPRLEPGNRLSKELMLPASREPEDEAERDSPEPSLFKAVETLTKGLEIPLPDGVSYLDKGKDERRRARVCWWDAAADTYRKTALRLTDEQRAKLPDKPIPAHLRLGCRGEKPVFFGHYGLDPRSPAVGPRQACVDYSSEEGGRLCAYRYDGEPELHPSQLVHVRLGR